MDNVIKKELAERDGTARPRLEKLRPEKSAHMQPKDMLQPVAEGEKETLRHTGIDILGDVRWGTHFCLFYHTKEDLINILVPYFKAGLDNNEFCMWVISEPLNAEDAKQALKHAVRNLDAYLRKGQIEILDYTDWYTKSGAFEADSVLQGWIQKHDQAITNGFDGLRLTGNTFWLEKKDWVKFTDYEAVVNNVIGKYKMLAVCTYSLDKCGASEILDVEHNHQFALIKWRGDWKILESSSKNQLEARLAEQTAIAQVLERSKKDWVKTFNAMSDWVALIDLKGRILRTNRAGENFTGKTLDEITGQSCCKLVHGSDKHIPGCPLRITLHTRQRATAELQVPNTDRWLMVTTDPVINSEGNIVGAVHITQDITERKKDEKALRESEERYKYLFEQSPLGISLATPDGKVLRTNKTMEVITGYFEEELKKIDLADTYENPADRKKLFETLERYGCAVDFPTRLKRKDGTVYDALLNVSRVHLAGQELLQTICMDVTEQKKAEDALRESEGKYRQLVSTTTDAIMLFDAQTRQFIDVNKACEGLYGYSREEFLALKHEDITAEPDKSDDSNKKALKGELTRIPVRYHKKKDGTVFPVEISASTFELVGRKVLCGVVRDITDRKKAEAEIENIAKFPSENPYPVLRIARDGTILYANDASAPVLQTWGCKKGQRLPDPCYKRAQEALASGKVSTFEFECNDGRIFFIALAPVADAGYVNAYGIDITERKMGERKLFAYQARLKSLASQLTLTEERERRRIAADLHDHVSQSLSFSKMKLEAIRIAESSAETERVLAEVSDLLGQTIDSTKSLTFDLSSPILYELGFEAAVADWLTEQIERKHNIKTEFKDDRQPKPLDDDIRVLLFRNVKELLINVIKHAQAGKVKVSIRKADTQIRISVEDDGVGFDPAETMSMAARRAKFGLFSIRERLEELGGYLEIDSAPGRGCRVTMTTPLKNAKK